MVPALQSYAGGMPEALQPVAAWLLSHTYLVVFFGALIDATGIPFPGRLILVAAGAFAVGVVAASAATAQAAQTTATAASTPGKRRFDQGWTAGFDRYGRGVRLWIIPWNGRGWVTRA